MKRLLFLLLIFFSANLFAQDWALFPYKQKSYFVASQNPTILEVFDQDSIRNEVDRSYLFFNKISPLYQFQECYDEMVTAIYDEPYQQNTFFFDSLTIVEDTLYYFNTEFGALPFFFIPGALVGESWEVASGYGGASFPSVVISCDSIHEEIFLGITDSIKYFSLHSTGTSAGANTIDSFLIKLSKNHGLIDFIPFMLFLQLPETEISYYSYSLKGFSNASESAGIVNPKWSGFLNHIPGDVRKWEHYSGAAPGGLYYYKVDTIVDVLNYEDSVVYLLETASGSEREVYKKNVLQYALEGPGNWPVFGSSDPFYNYTFYNAENASILYSYYTFIDDSTFFPELSLKKSYASFEYALHNTSEGCWVESLGFEGGFSGYSFETILGLTYEYETIYTGSSGYDDYAKQSRKLIGAKIGDIEWGDLTPLSIVQHNEHDFMNIYPNPASSQIHLNLSSNKNYTYKIYNFNNQLVSAGVLENAEIQIAELLQGIYFLELQNENEILRGKFVKM